MACPDTSVSTQNFPSLFSRVSMGWLVIFSFNFSNASWYLFSHFHSFFLFELVERFCHITEAFDKSLVKVCKPQEAFYFFYLGWGLPLLPLLCCFSSVLLLIQQLLLELEFLQHQNWILAIWNIGYVLRLIPPGNNEDLGKGYDDMIGCATCSLSQRLMQ